MWAIGQLGDTRWGKAGTITTEIGTYGRGTNKCNLFVAEAYATGAGVGYVSNNRLGVPLFGRNPFRPHPASANTLGDRNVFVSHFAVFSDYPVPPGAIVAFGSEVGSGHSTLWCGSGILIYAGGEEVKLGTFNKNQAGHQQAVFRVYDPFNLSRGHHR